MVAIKFAFDLQKNPGLINPLVMVGILHYSKQEAGANLLYKVKLLTRVEATTQVVILQRKAEA